MDIKELIGAYLSGVTPVMQLATIRQGKPAVCSVWFVADGQMNVYWLSLPSREHSKDIGRDPRVAAAVAIKADEPTIGIQLSGTASVVNDEAQAEEVISIYITKYQKGGTFLPLFKKGINKHNLYCLVPDEISLFDERHFPGGEKKTIKLR